MSASLTRLTNWACPDQDQAALLDGATVRVWAAPQSHDFRQFSVGHIKMASRVYR